MKYLKITNKGLLDIRLIALMGGTTKAGDHFKIGNFGTGLKYTLAYMFRNDIDFSIHVGEEQVTIDLDHEKIGDETFDIICIDGHRTSITTKMGYEWEAWMIIREIYSNALDEGEATYEITESVEGIEGHTSFFIELTTEIMEVYNSWDDYFIVGKESFYEDKHVKLFPHTGNLKVYKQGILIHKHDIPSLFSYDVRNAEINELREYKGTLHEDLSKIILGLNVPKVIQYFMENVRDDHFESKIDFDYAWGKSFSKEWKETMEGSKVIHQKAYDDLQARGIEVDLASNMIVPKNLYEVLTSQFDGIGALRASKEVNDFFEIYNEALQDKVAKAQKMLEEAGYYIEPELEYIYGVFGDKTVLAKVDFDSKKIYMSEKHLDSDMFSICTTLVEENEHYKTGFRDESREFQQHFIDMYTNQIIEKASINLL